MDVSNVAVIISSFALIISFYTFYKNYLKPFKLIAFPSPRIVFPHMKGSEPGILLHLFFKNKGAIPGIITGLKVVFDSDGKTTEFYSYAVIKDLESLAKKHVDTLGKSIFDGIYLDKFEVTHKKIYFLKRNDQDYHLGKTIATIYYKKNGKRKFIKLPNSFEFYLVEKHINSDNGITFANFLPHEFVMHEDLEAKSPN